MKKSLLVIFCCILLGGVFSMATSAGSQGGEKTVPCYYYRTDQLLEFIGAYPKHQSLSEFVEYYSNKGCKAKENPLEYDENNQIVGLYNRPFNQEAYELCTSDSTLQALLNKWGIYDTIKKKIVFDTPYTSWHRTIGIQGEKNTYFVPLLIDKSEYRGLQNKKAYTLYQFKAICIEKPYKWIMFDKEVKPSVTPFGMLDYVYVPLRTYYEKQGHTVNWDDETRTISVDIVEGKYELPLEEGAYGRIDPVLNGERVAHSNGDYSYYIKDGTTMVAINGGVLLDWDSYVNFDNCTIYTKSKAIPMKKD